MTPTKTATTSPSEQHLFDETARLANRLDQFFATTKTSDGKELTEGMVRAAIGQLMAHRNKEPDQLRRVLADITIAASAYARNTQ